LKAQTGNFLEWFEGNQHRLTGYGVWLRGGELNTLPAEAFAERPFRILIARLSTYFDTVDSWTHKLLYSLAVADPAAFADLAYLPPQNDLAIFKADGVPVLLGTGTKRPPSGFHLLALSNSCVQELINLPRLMAGSGIPLKKSERMSRPDVPLVILGGANAMNTSALWTDDPLLDGVFVGTGAESVRALFGICRDAFMNGVPKQKIVEVLETVDGFFQPDKIRPTRKAPSLPPSADGLPEGAPVLYGESQPGCAPLAISEGCPCFCGFCSEAWVRKPYRETPYDVLTAKMDAMKAGMGISQIEFSSFNFNVHSRIFDLLWHAAGRFDRIRLKSQRFDRIADDPAVVQILVAAGKTSMTCGLEGISARLRRYLNKGLDDGKIVESLASLHVKALRELKIFLIATGLENAEDLREFDLLLDALRSVQMEQSQYPRTIFSVTPLVRFPWTPLEFEDAPTSGIVAGVAREIAGRVRSHGFEFRESSPPHEYWVSQVLARAADPRIGDALVEACLDTEALYYRNIPERFAAVFRNRLAKRDFMPDGLLRGKPPAQSGDRPWRSIRTGVRLDFLIRQYEKNRVFLEVPSCLGSGASPGDCSGCGACPDDAAMTGLTRAAQNRAYSASKFGEWVRTARGSVREIPLKVRASVKNRGIPRNLLAAAAASGLMSAERKLTPHYFGFTKSFWDERENPPWVWGDDILTLRWNGRGGSMLTDLLRDPEFLEKVNQKTGDWGSVAGAAPESPEWFDLMIRSPFPFDLSVYLKKTALGGTVRKTPEGGYRYDFTKESVRKKILSALTLPDKAPDLWTLTVTAGPKFSVEAFLKDAFTLPDPKAWVRISVECLFPPMEPSHEILVEEMPSSRKKNR
jgi:radical SAM superfamily enzyme YgiQ (UPF0313 family)